MSCQNPTLLPPCVWQYIWNMLDFNSKIRMRSISRWYRIRFIIRELPFDVADDVYEIFPHLYTLKISRNNNNATAKLEQFRSLKTLFVNDKKIQYDISKLSHLQELHIGASNIVGVQSLVNLTHLNISFTTLSVDFKFLTKLTVLKIRYNDSYTNLSALTNLTYLDMAYGNISTDILLFSNLTYLDISYVNYTTLNRLSNLFFPKLTTLKIIDNDLITDISTLTNLTSLDMSNRSALSISSLTNLTKLDISQTDIFVDMSCFPKLTTLRMKNNRAITDVSPLINLTELDISGTDVNYIGNLVHLKKLNLSNNNKVTNISPLTNLISLELFDNAAITDISTNNLIETLDIRHSRITDISAQKLLKKIYIDRKCKISISKNVLVLDY